MWTESNTPSKIEGAGGADVPKALIYIMADQGIRFNRALKRQDHVNEINRRINVDEYDFVNIEQEVDFIIKSDIGLNPHILAEIIYYSYKKC